MYKCKVFEIPPALRFGPSRRLPSSNFLAGRGEFLSASREMAQIPGLSWSNPEGWYCISEFKNNYFTEMCSCSEAGSYLRLMEFCITQL